MKLTTILAILLIALVTSVIVIIIRPQTGEVTVIAVEKDEKRVLPSVLIRLDSWSQSTNELGIARFPKVQPGTYRLRMESKDFVSLDLCLLIRPGSHLNVTLLTSKAHPWLKELHLLSPEELKPNLTVKTLLDHLERDGFNVVIAFQIKPANSSLGLFTVLTNPSGNVAFVVKMPEMSEASRAVLREDTFAIRLVEDKLRLIQPRDPNLPEDFDKIMEQIRKQISEEMQKQLGKTASKVLEMQYEMTKMAKELERRIQFSIKYGCIETSSQANEVSALIESTYDIIKNLFDLLIDP